MKSLANAKDALQEAQLKHKDMVIPKFIKGNAKCIPFPDNTFDCVFSLGVLHHSPDTVKAIEEVKRVLKKGGTAFVFLYRRWSPKLMTANTIRRLLPTFAKEKLCVELRKNRNTRKSTRFGTMLEECLGVPIMRSYTKKQIQTLFFDFDKMTIGPTGSGFPIGAKFFDRFSMLSYMFQITLEK